MVMLKLEDQPPLIQAIFSGEIDDVKNLLDTKLDVNYQDAEKRSPLHAAAFKGDKELAELLLAQGARVNTKDCKWLTPLHRACGVGSEDTVALLLSHNADTTARDRQWQTPLHIAAANNAVECVSHLLHYVPNVNVTDRSGRTALHHAALNGHNDVVELLISKGCIVNACDKKDCRPIHWAAHLGHVDTMELLMRNGADIHVKDRNQYTPLHVAAASGMLYACRLLLHAGADFDAQNSFGNTPLHIACLNGHLPVCQELAMYNANLEAVNYRGQTPLHIAAASTQGVACLTYLLDQNVNINKQSLDGRTALHMSAIHGRFTRSKTLIDKGAIVDSQDKNGNTALHIAAQYGHDILTTTLLDYGADPNKRGYEGRTSLHSCCLSGFVEVSRKFIQIKVDLNTTDDTGKTAVHCAAYKGSVECLDLLVSQGANFKLQDMYGRTPLHYSATQGHYTCVFTLVGIGAPVNVIDNEGCTPLHLAAAYDLEGRCVEYLLQHKADPKMKDGRGYTPVHYAVNGSNSNSLGHLLEAAGKNYNFQEEGMPLNTPLHLAARRGDIKILNSVISYFPDVNIKNDTGCTPLLIAAREGHTHSVQMLLRYGAKVGICEVVYNMSPVHYSAKNGHMHCLALLVDNTEDKNIIDKPDKFNRTALMLAISGSHIKCVLTLLKSEANPNIVDSDRHSSLFRAVVTNQNNVVQYLISKGAYVSEPDISGKTVLHLASACGHFVCLQTVMLYMPVEKAASLDNHDFSALHWGCYQGYYTCVEYLLQKGVFKKIEGNPFSPVHCATFVGSERCLELLYNAFGAEIVKLIDTRKRTPLHIAALHGHTDCARYLLEQGAEIESKDEFGRTALIAASQNGQSQMLELLIAYKANVKSCDNNGNTALHMACLKKHSHTALLLLEYINDVDTINMVNNDKKTPLHLTARNGLVDVTRNLIKKGSSVLAVDSIGLTPALCCAPNPSVAQCLAIILANHPTQFPVVNHSTKAEDQHLFQKLVANLTLPNVTLRTSLIQTDMSLQRDPCELFDAIVQKIKPDYVKKALKSPRKKAHIVYSSPNLHKTHRTKPDIILIEKYGKNDGFDDSFKEVKGLGLHRSFSEITLVPTVSDDDRNVGLDLRCNRIENLDSVLKPMNRKLDFHKNKKDFDLIINKISRQKSKSSLNLAKETLLTPDMDSINIRMAELIEFHESVQKDVITVANCSIPQKESTHSKDEPSTSSQSSPPPVVNYDDAFKPVTKKLKTAPSKMENPEEEKMRCQGDVAMLQEDKTEKLCCASRSSTRMRKKLCTCQYVCEKCVLKNTFDEFEIDDNADDLEVSIEENQEDQGNRDADYQLHRVTTRKLGINDDEEELEKDPGKEKQLTPAELAAFLRDEPETSTSLGAYKKQLDRRQTSKACGSTSDVWPKVTLDSDRIIMPLDIDRASTTLIKTVESKASNYSPAMSVQLLCDNFNEEKTPSLSNRMSRDSLEDIDRYPDDDADEDRRKFMGVEKSTRIKQVEDRKNRTVWDDRDKGFVEVEESTHVKKADSDLMTCQGQRSQVQVDFDNKEEKVWDNQNNTDEDAVTKDRRFRGEDQKSMIYPGLDNTVEDKWCRTNDQNLGRRNCTGKDCDDTGCNLHLENKDGDNVATNNPDEELKRRVELNTGIGTDEELENPPIEKFLPGGYFEPAAVTADDLFEENLICNDRGNLTLENVTGTFSTTKSSTLLEPELQPTILSNAETISLLSDDSGIILSASILEDDETSLTSFTNDIAKPSATILGDKICDDAAKIVQQTSSESNVHDHDAIILDDTICDDTPKIVQQTSSKSNFDDHEGVKSSEVVKNVDDHDGANTSVLKSTEVAKSPSLMRNTTNGVMSSGNLQVEANMKKDTPQTAKSDEDKGIKKCTILQTSSESNVDGHAVKSSEVVKHVDDRAIKSFEVVKNVDDHDGIKSSILKSTEVAKSPSLMRNTTDTTELNNVTSSGNLQAGTTMKKNTPQTAKSDEDKGIKKSTLLQTASDSNIDDHDAPKSSEVVKNVDDHDGVKSSTLKSTEVVKTPSLMRDTTDATELNNVTSSGANMKKNTPQTAKSDEDEGMQKSKNEEILKNEDSNPILKCTRKTPLRTDDQGGLTGGTDNGMEKSDQDLSILSATEKTDERMESITWKGDDAEILKKDNNISILDDIGRTMENNLEESSSILDKIRRTIEETNAAAIMDSIDGIKQLIIHSNVALEGVGKTIEGGSCCKPDATLSNDGSRNLGQSQQTNFGRFNDEPSFSHLEVPSNSSTDELIASSRFDTKLVKSLRFNDIQMQDAKNNLGITSVPPSTLSSTYFNDDPVNQATLSTGIKNLILTEPSPTELMYESTYERNSPDLFNIDASTNQTSPSSSLFDIASTELNGSSDDHKAFRSFVHSDNNLESIIIDNAVVSSSIDPTHVLGRCSVDSEYFDSPLLIDESEIDNQKIRESFGNPLLKHKSFDETSVAGSLFQHRPLQDFTVGSNIFEDGIESEDEAFDGQRCTAPVIGDVSVASRRNNKQEEKASRKCGSKGGIKMRMKKSEEGRCMIS